MEMGFWKNLKRPFVVIAPMADVTDPAFRQIIAKYSRMGQTGSDNVAAGGGPAVMWTEFVSADGLCSAGRKILQRDLAYSENERPIVAQLFTAHPTKMYEAVALARRLGFDGVDINMGCPDKSVEKQGAGAALMKTPTVAQEVIRAAVKAATEPMFVGEGTEGAVPLKAIPISVKTRVGYNAVELATWIPALLSEDIAALTIHARTRKEMSDVPARWEFVKEVVAMRDALRATSGKETFILGNGDVTTLEDADAKLAATGADGAMVGRGIFGNPWFFDRTSPMRHPLSATARLDDPAVLQYIETKLRVMVEHTTLFEKLLGDYKNFAIMKKHYKAYVHGWNGSKELRMRLMEAATASEVAAIVEKYIEGVLHVSKNGV